ncbi:hypothetical protein [Bdellovibrio sp. HCB209]|uniref:hypothetical protein n=1 Tax=Bdellovibrio sp. HCB209 TaxID=3394354 RepID=UPI0039B5B44C
MKNALRLFVCLMAILVAMSVNAETPKAAASDDDAPIYIMDYDELKKITKEQKSFYMGQLIAQAPKMSALTGFTKDKILSAAKDEEHWDELEKQVIAYCNAQSVDTCKPLQAARVKAFKMGATH